MTTRPLIPTCGIDHIVLHVVNLANSCRFYENVLGCMAFFATEGHVFLRTGDCQIGLFEAQPTHAPKAYAELDHLCLRTFLREREVLSKLKAYKIATIPRPEGLGWPTHNLQGIYFRDPDAHVLQLLPLGTWPQVYANAAHQ